MNPRYQKLLSLALMLDHPDPSSLPHDDCVPPETDDKTARHALLISSFTEGVLKSEEAQVFLRDGLLSSMLRQEVTQLGADMNEQETTSASCIYDDPTVVKAIEQQANGGVAPPDLILDHLEEQVVRFVYIPTAMFGKRGDDKPYETQLEEARQVARSRRRQITDHVATLLGDAVSIHAVTLDLNDGLLGDKEGAKTEEEYPSNGREALGDWKPHLVYIEGGNTFWLYHCIEKGDWKEAIMNAVTGEDAAVYCGKSAGAIVAGATVDTATWKEWDDPSIVPGKEEYDDWKEMEGLDIINGSSIFPHMGEKWTSMVAQNRKRVESPVHCISDSEICLFDGLRQEFSVVSAQ